jgi:hypothetical protein
VGAFVKYVPDDVLDGCGVEFVTSHVEYSGDVGVGRVLRP